MRTQSPDRINAPRLFEEPCLDESGVCVDERNCRVLFREFRKGKVGHGDAEIGRVCEGVVLLQVEVGQVERGIFFAQG